MKLIAQMEIYVTEMNMYFFLLLVKILQSCLNIFAVFFSFYEFFFNPHQNLILKSPHTYACAIVLKFGLKFILRV